jgi:CelD/BcsL family acetyltransferase involved in cellulose biosynthesis
MSTLARVRIEMPGATTGELHVRIVSSFDDPSVAMQVWNRLLAAGHTDSVNLTWQWQRNWWEHFGRGQLLLLIVESDGEPLCIAPLFADEGMVFNICPEDQLDLIGPVVKTRVMESILLAIRQSVPVFQGMKLYFIPDSSPTGLHLERAAERLGLMCIRESCLAAPRLDIATSLGAAMHCTRKNSLTRHENFFRRTGDLKVSHSRDPEEICPQLDEFFSQHIARRNATAFPSIFIDTAQREYYREIVRRIGPTGWLRFTRLEWNGRSIAFHLGVSYQGRFLFGIPSFDIELRRHSPGEVLLRQLLLAAMEEGADVFDFGPGDEAYKYRFANGEVQLVTWGVYPESSSSNKRVR